MCSNILDMSTMTKVIYVILWLRHMEKQVIQFSHANGFPAACYATLFSLLNDQFDIQYVDTIGHSPKFPVTNNWLLLVDELIAAIELAQKTGHHKKPVIGLGHSLGATLSLFAAIKRPDLFKALILLDAPIFSFPKAQIVNFLKRIHRIYWVTPAGERTERRRAHWHSFEEALAYFRSRSLFKNFSENALHDFVNYGTFLENGYRKLKFNPVVEAQIYRTLPHNYSQHKYQLTIPTIAIIGKNSRILHGMDIRFMRKYFNIHLKKTEGGHLFPFEYPEETARVIKASISELLTGER